MQHNNIDNPVIRLSLAKTFRGCTVFKIVDNPISHGLRRTFPLKNLENTVSKSREDEHSGIAACRFFPSNNISRITFDYPHPLIVSI